jgi:5-methyltetrahydrofolate--homocysteine methyltransferase
LVLEKSFDPSSEEAQVFLSDLCDNIFNEEFADTVETNYTCPMDRFGEWLEEQSIATEKDAIYVDNCNGASGIPVPQEDFHSCIIAWAQKVGETSILPRDGKVTIMFLPFTSRVRYDDPYGELDDEWNLIEKWMKDQMKDAPTGVKRGYFSSFDFWWYDTNGQMLQTAYSAAAIALGCAAAVILFSSRSIVLTIFSTLTIGYVLTSVTATLVALGWTLGFLESICFAILIGVSGDFVIHLSHAYSNLPGDVDRGRRTKYALIKMGPSLLATAVTTILSAVIMLFTVITFFQKFALILFFTIIQASIGSFIIFLTMMDCIGPSAPTYLVDRFLLRKEVPVSEESERTEKVVAGDESTRH